MQKKDAQNFLLAGNIQRVIVRAPFGRYDSWTVEFVGNIGNANPILETARKQNREFATLDSAARALQQCYVTQFEVIQDLHPDG